MHLVVWSLLLAISLLPGCSPSSITEQAKLLGTSPFSKEAWAVAGQAERGKMVFSFLSLHEPKSLTSLRVKALLGEPTGYFDYDENLAYFVGPDSVESTYGKGHLLVFVTAKTSGRIVALKLVPETQVDFK